MVCKEKLNPDYLDHSINLHGDEKSEQLISTISLLDPNEPVNVLEVGPGGGIAIDGLNQYCESSSTFMNGVHITLVELFDSESRTLSKVVAKAQANGALITRVMGDIVNIPSADKSYDIVNCSAVFHEVFSYSGGVKALKQAINEVKRVTKDGGNLLYRDVYPIDVSLMLPVEQILTRDSWKSFASIFLPYFLDGPVHLYKDFNFRLNSSPSSDAVSFNVPAGLARELQRHYITFRDSIIRSGVLGFSVDSSRYNDTEWIRTDNGFEKKVYIIPKDGSENEATIGQSQTDIPMTASSFEDLVDDRLADFLEKCISGDSIMCNVLQKWLAREGRESYVYASSSGVLDMMCETDAKLGGFCISSPEDYQVRHRDFYTQYLCRVLGEHAFPDNKLIIRFTKT